MDLFTAMDISASGMRAQRTRMNVISSNMANAQTTRTDAGGPYQRRDVVFRENSFENQLASVEVESIISDPTPGKRIYDPHHPDADEQGYVSLPNVNLMEEMVNMVGASRAFEANTTAIKAQKDMALKALEIGRQ
ncbi:Flagellar basal-body rod protein FlgC [anaerobic digester metagenome]|uniref:Flagellar basal-body rod protein FlgC n=1 Tax=anaerobic digester metagenome TaxID=1263854 RepID=A0A485M3E0_9ZZZZ